MGEVRRSDRFKQTSRSARLLGWRKCHSQLKQPSSRSTHTPTHCRLSGWLAFSFICKKKMIWWLLWKSITNFMWTVDVNGFPHNAMAKVNGGASHKCKKKLKEKKSFRDLVKHSELKFWHLAHCTLRARSKPPVFNEFTLKKDSYYLLCTAQSVD